MNAKPVAVAGVIALLVGCATTAQEEEPSDFASGLFQIVVGAAFDAAFSTEEKHHQRHPEHASHSPASAPLPTATVPVAFKAKDKDKQKGKRS